MSTDLAEMQFEILPYAEAEFGIPFGIFLDVSVDEDGFQPGGPEWYTEDSENPLNGATAFGRDHMLGPTWQWQMHVNRDRTGNALATLGLLATAWRAQEVRELVGEVCSVRYRVGDRTRRIFGRPRRFEYTPTNRILGGYIPVSADFKCADSLTYDDVQQVVRLELQTQSLGGFVFPVTFPVTTLPSGEQDDQALVDGDADTYPVIRFEGPIVTPSLETRDWAITLDLSLADGEYVEIDTRPWAQTALLNGDVSVAGALGPRQWFSRMKFSPGRHDLSFRGASGSTGATCEVRWRSAWNSI